MNERIGTGVVEAVGDVDLTRSLLIIKLQQLERLACACCARAQHCVHGDAEGTQMITHLSGVAFAVAGEPSLLVRASRPSILGLRVTEDEQGASLVRPRSLNARIAPWRNSTQRQSTTRLWSSWRRRSTSPPTIGTGRASTSSWHPRPWSRCLTGSESTHRLQPPPGMPWQHATGSPGPGCCRRSWRFVRTVPRRYGCTSPTVTRSKSGSRRKPEGGGITSISWRTGHRPGRSTLAGSVRPRSRCPATYHWATTHCGPAATTTSPQCR